MFSLAFLIIHMQLVTATVAVGEDKLAQKHLTIPLTQRRGQGNLMSQALQAARKHEDHHDTSYLPIEPANGDGGFWYGTFDVGESKNLSLLIDTASQDVAVNPTRYKPTPESQNLHENGSLVYDTTQVNGCGTANISYSVYADTVSMAGLESRNQTLANVIRTRPGRKGVLTRFPHDGLVGFAGTSANETQPSGIPFLQNLCDQGQVEECRFGIALGTEGKGKQVLGGVSDDSFEGTLSRTPLYEGKEWCVFGNVAVNGGVVLECQLLFLDRGTANIVGPTEVVRSIFRELGIQAVDQSLPGCTSVLFGYYPCNSPPRVSFQFDPGSDGGGRASNRHDWTSPVLNILPSAFKQAENGYNNCTSIIIDLSTSVPLWIIGQAWFHDKYADFDVDGSRIGVAISEYEADGVMERRV